MLLVIRNVTKSDFGSYKCIAKNSLGETDGVIKLEGIHYIIYIDIDIYIYIHKHT